MTTKPIVVALVLSVGIGLNACSKRGERAQQPVGTAGASTESTPGTPRPTARRDRTAKLSEEEARQRGAEAVVYGYPLVIADVTRQVQTNVVTPQHNGRAPINQFSHFLRYPSAAYRDVVRINVDTLYSFAWLDLTSEPIVLSVPDTQDRYYLMPILDAWTNVFASPGKRTTGTQAGQFAIVGPNWTGSLPSGLTKLNAPTNTVMIAGRTQANGAADYAVVNAIQTQYQLTPLSDFGKPHTLPKGVVDPRIDMKTPPVEQVNQMSATAFFNRLSVLMAANPPQATDGPVLAKLASIGIVPGHPFDMTRLDPEVAKGLEASVRTAVTSLQASVEDLGKSANGWRMTPATLGNFGTAYGLRAVVALAGLGANIPQDAMYPTAFVDTDDQPLTGANRYVLHFDKGALPPANAFWSLTMYDAQSFLVENRTNRYNIAGWMPLAYNSDGSLDVYIQRDPPGGGKESNWLPTPPSTFSVTLRVYWPKEAMLDGAWKPPGIRKVEGIAKGTAPSWERLATVERLSARSRPVRQTRHAT